MNDPAPKLETIDQPVTGESQDPLGERPAYSDEPGTGDDEHSLEDGSFWSQRETIVIAIAGVLYFTGLIVELLLPDVFNPSVNQILPGLRVSDVLLLSALTVGGYHTARRGLRAVLNFRMSINFLVSVAVVGALVLGKFIEAASLAFLYGVAELLEDYAMYQAQGSLKELLELSPQVATVLRDKKETTVNVENIKVGETVVVRPGEKISMDGIVLEGTSSVNEAPVTGESLPVDKTPGDEVFAGTFNEGGYLEIKVTKKAEENTLAKIIEMVREANVSKAPSQRFVDQFAGYYTPIVVGLALFVGLVLPVMPGVAGGFSTWWLRAMALLVIACPCGLLISTPVTIVSGITSASKHGTLIKGGEPFEGLGQLNVICFDKTGTLTEGEPSVSDVLTFNGTTKQEVLRTAAGLESKSEHHLSEAIIRCARENSIEAADVSDFESITASGVSGRMNGERYYIGKPELLDVEVPREFEELESEGKTAVALGSKTKLLGIIGIADGIRDEARRTIRDLHQEGIEVVMITGDNKRTARSVAEELSIDHYYGELLPGDKVEMIDQLREKYGRVAMVGDGINDAPALAKADVGIAMGAAGSDTAIETADIALMGDNLNHVVYAVRLSRKGENIIKQNIFSSIAVKLVLGIGVIPGLVNLITAVLFGDMAVAFGIIGNAMRLRKIKHQDQP